MGLRYVLLKIDLSQHLEELDSSKCFFCSFLFMEESGSLDKMRIFYRNLEENEVKDRTRLLLSEKGLVVMAEIIKITDATFESEVVSSELPVLVDFWAEWCGPCRMIAPVLEQLSQEMDGKIKICKLNVDENSQTPGKFGVMSIPTLVIFKNGEEKERIIGYQTIDELKRKVEAYL